jgi:hypothetical protein
MNYYADRERAVALMPGRDENEDLIHLFRRSSVTIEEGYMVKLKYGKYILKHPLKPETSASE